MLLFSILFLGYVISFRVFYLLMLVDYKQLFLFDG